MLTDERATQTRVERLEERHRSRRRSHAWLVVAVAVVVALVAGAAVAYQQGLILRRQHPHPVAATRPAVRPSASAVIVPSPSVTENLPTSPAAATLPATPGP